MIDHDNKPVATAGYKGLAILSTEGKSQRIVLAPADGAKLTGKAEAALPAQPKGVVQITSARRQDGAGEVQLIPRARPTTRCSDCGCIGRNRSG